MIGERSGLFQKNNRTILVYYIASIGFILLGIIMLLISHGQFLGDIIWDGAHDHSHAGDFYIHLIKVKDGRPYVTDDLDARFPPLAYLFYYFMTRIIPDSIENSGVWDWYTLYSEIVLCLTVCGIVLSFKELLRDRIKNVGMFCLIFLVSQPFAFAAIKAANSASYVLAMVLLALCYKDSESKVKREAALLLIAVAAGFKVTPAILGLIYLKERRFKEAARLVVYGIIAYTVPFIFLGGIEAFKNYIYILSQVSSMPIPRPETIIGVCVEAASLLGTSLQTGFLVGKILAYLYLAFTVITFFILPKDWKSICLLLSNMTIFVNQSYPYTLMYFVISLIYLLVESDGEWKDCVYVFMFAAIFNGYPFLKIDWPLATFITNYFWVYVMVGMLVVVQSVRMIKIKKYLHHKGKVVK